MKTNKVSKSFSKSSKSFFPKNDKESKKEEADEIIENDETRREAIKENLKKMIALKKENHLKAKEILVT